MTDFYDELRDENAMLSALNDAQAATIRDMGQSNRALEAENARLVDELEVAYKAVNEAACLSNPDYKEARAGPVITLDLIHQRVQDAVGGMLLRDYFASKALNGLLSNDEYPPRELTSLEDIAAHYARISYVYADAMMTERENSNDHP